VLRPGQAGGSGVSPWTMMRRRPSVASARNVPGPTARRMPVVAPKRLCSVRAATRFKAHTERGAEGYIGASGVGMVRRRRSAAAVMVAHASAPRVRGSSAGSGRPFVGTDGEHDEAAAVLCIRGENVGARTLAADAAARQGAEDGPLG